MKKRVPVLSLPFIFLLRLYRKYVSPCKRSPTCRFSPTCSQYAIEALTEWGVVIGSCMSLWRLLRCNPFSKGGYDPVPKREDVFCKTGHHKKDRS